MLPKEGLRQVGTDPGPGAAARRGARTYNHCVKRAVMQSTVQIWPTTTHVSQASSCRTTLLGPSQPAPTCGKQLSCRWGGRSGSRVGALQIARSPACGCPDPPSHAVDRSQSWHEVAPRPGSATHLPDATQVPLQQPGPANGALRPPSQRPREEMQILFCGLSCCRCPRVVSQIPGSDR